MMAKGQLSNQIKNKVGALNSQVGMAKQQMQQAIGNTNNQMNNQASEFGNLINFH
jgi:hypothetical protein